MALSYYDKMYIMYLDDQGFDIDEIAEKLNKTESEIEMFIEQLYEKD